MRYFPLLDFQHLILAFFLGLLAVVFIYVGWWIYPGPGKETKLTEKELFSHDESRHHPIPPILYFIYTGAVLWAVGYLMIIIIQPGAVS